MELRASDKPQNKTAKQPSLISTAIDTSFQADASVRQALTENLKPLRAESEAIAARLHKAFENFNAHHQRALAAGARIAHGPHDHSPNYRAYEALDLEGPRWRFLQRIGEAARS
jgi:hypothetical protein